MQLHLRTVEYSLFNDQKVLISSIVAANHRLILVHFYSNSSFVRSGTVDTPRKQIKNLCNCLYCEVFSTEMFIQLLWIV